MKLETAKETTITFKKSEGFINSGYIRISHAPAHEPPDQTFHFDSRKWVPTNEAAHEKPK
jgi:hypothetical protein